jgi:antitoxin VapB
MGLNIKNPEAEQLIHELAEATGESLTGAITVAVRERLNRIQEQRGAVVAERAARLRAIGEDAANHWTEPYKTRDHGDLLYDDAGLPL